MKKVEVYLLWKDGTWTKMTVEVPLEPWTDNAVEVAACERAWLEVTKAGGAKPIQIGLIMSSFYNTT
jgi:hypothetical protein